MRSKGGACAGHTHAWNDSAHLKGLEFPVSVLGRYRLGTPHELDLSIHVGLMPEKEAYRSCFDRVL